MALQIEQIPVLNDNYVYLIRDHESGLGGVVDPALSAPVLDRAKELGWSIDFILNTHHHGDHVGGNLVIKQETGCKIVGPRNDNKRIPGIDIEVGENDEFVLGQSVSKVIEVPGHTRGHIAYSFIQDHALFCGDSLFVLGCGRMFEGTPKQMWSSLTKLRELPDAMRVYCAHEYSQANAAFALSVDPLNQALQQKAQAIGALRAQDKPTVPSTLGEEKCCNPFLRADDPTFAGQLQMESAEPFRVFGKLRSLKDKY